jgi:DNA-binding transcriptional LysR family regulator
MASKRTISAVVAVADNSSFRVAANHLGMSQPALTRLIQGHESEIGFRIFGRDTKTVWLTDEGEAYITACRGLLSHIRNHDAAIKSIKVGKTGSLSVGHMDAATLGRLPDLIRRFSLDNPRVDVRMSLMGSDQQVAAVRAGELDVGFVLTQARAPDLEYRPIETQRLAIVMSSADPRAGAATVSMRDFVEDLFIFSDRNNSGALMRLIDSILQKTETRPRIFYTSQDTLTVMALVRSGLGVTLMPHIAADMISGGLHYAEVAGHAPSLGVEMVVNPERQSSTTRQFIKIVECDKRVHATLANDAKARTIRS